MPTATRQSRSSGVNGRGATVEASGSQAPSAHQNGAENAASQVEITGSRRVRLSDSQAGQMQKKMRYNPNGNAKEKRELRQEYRQIIAETQDARKNIADKTASDLTTFIQRVQPLFDRVEATSEAVLDSRFLLNASEMGAQLAKGMKVGFDFDVEQYLTRCARLIGGRLRRNVEFNHDEEDLMDQLPDTDFWHWDRLGRRAVKRTRRAMTMDHLLGPLNLEHNKRTLKQRAGVDISGPVVKPTQMQSSDIVKNEGETSVLVKQISDRLGVVGGRDGVNLFRFVLDPHSFANSVENLFYVSFLVRDGTASLDLDNEEGEPILMSCEEPDEEDRAHGITRRQIVMELDMNAWRALIQLHKIKEPLIATRAAQVHDARMDTWAAAGAAARNGIAAPNGYSAATAASVSSDEEEEEEEEDDEPSS